MEQTTRVHLLFRGASEVAKRFRAGSLFCELIAASISLWAILLKPSTAVEWLPLGILLLTFLGTCLRSYSLVANGFAQRCRRISLRAFCAGNDVDRLTISLLDDDAPPFVEKIANSLPAKSIEEYYEPTATVGRKRLAELYAHSAFYTWRLLRVQAWLTFIPAVLTLITCFVMIYRLAAVSTSQTDRQAVLEAVCTVVLLVVTAKGLQASWDSYCSFGEIRSIENALLRKNTVEALNDLVDSYDIERAGGAMPMTTLYKLLRACLSKEWHSRRKNFIHEPE